jgi:hypothetical protein
VEVNNDEILRLNSMSRLKSKSTVKINFKIEFRIKIDVQIDVRVNNNVEVNVRICQCQNDVRIYVEINAMLEMMLK